MSERKPTTTEEKIEEIQARLLEPGITVETIDKYQKILAILREEV